MEIDICKGCGKKTVIVNRKYHLCEDCNYTRLHGDKPKKKYTIKPHSKKAPYRYIKDEETYEEVFKIKPHKCEECGKELSPVFRNEEGVVVDRFQYSHILSKGAFSEFRNDPRNINRLCMDCHSKWEFGNKKEMRIYEKNSIIINTLLEEHRR